MANDLVTVFRSADEDAPDEAAGIAALLKSAGIDATILDDRAPGIPEGAWEVRVSRANVSQAESLIAAAEAESPDDSDDLDLVPVFRSGDGTSEGDVEALTIKNLLVASGIPAVLVGGDVPIPSLNQEVRVAREDLAEARRIIRDARASGRAAADQAEAESESSS